MVDNCCLTCIHTVAITIKDMVKYANTSGVFNNITPCQQYVKFAKEYTCIKLTDEGQVLAFKK